MPRHFWKRPTFGLPELFFSWLFGAISSISLLFFLAPREGRASRRAAAASLPLQTSETVSRKSPAVPVSTLLGSASADDPCPPVVVPTRRADKILFWVFFILALAVGVAVIVATMNAPELPDLDDVEGVDPALLEQYARAQSALTWVLAITAGVTAFVSVLLAATIWRQPSTKQKVALTAASIITALIPVYIALTVVSTAA